MLGINPLAIVAAAVVAFIIGAVWNGVFSTALVAHNPAMGSAGAPQMVAEAVRCLVVATVLAALFRLAGIESLGMGLVLAALIWLGFQAALLSGAVIWDGLPVHIYAIHVGDALAKIVVMAAILGLWR